jgi:thymidylate synthase (FAD)
LINYMMKHKHGTPFEHINFTFHIKCPIFIARQWFRHRIGSFNEISGRYVKLNTLFWNPTEWRKNLNPRNKQDSVVGEWSEAELEGIDSTFQSALETILNTYEFLLEQGVAREQARAILPVGTYTEFYWTVNARSLFNFLELRTHHTAQKEMQEYAQAVGALSAPIAPITFSAWENLGHNGN